MSNDEGWRIDELARVAGVTARNLRAYQSQGLLAAPRLVGRVGRYDADHLDRVRAILRLQASGFSLAGIKVLFAAHAQGRTLGELLGVDPSGSARTARRACRMSPKLGELLGVDPSGSGLDRGAPTAHLPRLALLPGPWADRLAATSPPTN